MTMDENNVDATEEVNVDATEVADAEVPAEDAGTADNAETAQEEAAE